MSEPWTTKQHAWVKEQYHQGRKVGEFWEEFEPIFGVKRTKCAFYQYVKKIAIEEGRVAKMRREGTLGRKKRERVCWLSEREQTMEREWGV